MSKLLMGLGAILLVSGLVLFLTRTEPILWATDLPATTIGAIDRLAIDPDRLKEAINTANDRANFLNDQGVAYQSWSRVLLFFVFGSGAAIAFFAGLQKMFDDLGKKKAPLPVVTGLLGIVSAVASFSADHFEGEAKSNFVCISAIEKEVRKTVDDIRSEPDASLAEQYLNEMQRTILRCPL